MKYTFCGHQHTLYPGRLHPVVLDGHGQGILAARPGDEIDFGDETPPPDGLWYDEDGNRVVVAGIEPADDKTEDDDEDDGTGPGTGAGDDSSGNNEE